MVAWNSPAGWERRYMRNFYCGACGARVYFQNTRCLSCHCAISLDLDSVSMVAVSGEKADLNYKRCRNGVDHENCNWAIRSNSNYEYCYSCRLNDVIPDLNDAKNRMAWGKIEDAKRRLIFNLERLGLRPQEKTDANPDGLSFRFLGDTGESEEERVLTGHASGIVTLNIIEADDVEREKMRTAMKEPYRTLVGHMRHEVGHYYWDRLVVGDALEAFRRLFGDETQDYGEALEKHYKNGPPSNWEVNHISAYAAAHPWEDWAETWAHYLHMMDSLGTAFHSKIKIDGERNADPVFNYEDLDLKSFESVIAHWPGIVCMVNSFNRSLGKDDPYPFIMPPTVVEKLKFIHKVIPVHGPAV